jgi:hypothetical protein
MYLQKIYNSIYRVYFDNHADLAMCFLRFQEHYESPYFRGRFFSLNEYKIWYSQTYGSFSYVDDWSGFNVPSYIFEPFKSGKFGDLSDLEEKIIASFAQVRDPYYVIGTNDNDATLDHEICHALFYVDDLYRESVTSTIETHKAALSPLFNKILSLGYHEAVLIDEANAYLCANPDWIEEQDLTVDYNLVEQLQRLRDEALHRRS